MLESNLIALEHRPDECASARNFYFHSIAQIATSLCVKACLSAIETAAGPTWEEAWPSIDPRTMGNLYQYALKRRTGVRCVSRAYSARNPVLFA